MEQIEEFFEFGLFGLEVLFGVVSNAGSFFTWLPVSVISLVGVLFSIAAIWRFMGWGG